MVGHKVVSMKQCSWNRKGQDESRGAWRVTKESARARFCAFVDKDVACLQRVRRLL